LSAKSALDVSLSRVVVVAKRSDIVGSVQYRIESPRLHLIGLAVHPVHHKRGVARRLVDHLAEIACGRILEVASLYAVNETGNPDFFERLGFRP
jgi:N-acetylglutamate synthase-like GNAT family acetyltransferase